MTTIRNIVLFLPLAILACAFLMIIFGPIVQVLQLIIIKFTGSEKYVARNKPLTKTNLVWMLGNLQGIETDFYTVAGELALPVYGDGTVLSRIRHKLESGKKFHILAGPEFMVGDDEGARPPIFEFLASPDFHLYAAPKRIVYHFRVINGKDVYYEDPHGRLQPNRTATIINNTFVVGKVLKAIFKKLIAFNSVVRVTNDNLEGLLSSKRIQFFNKAEIENRRREITNKKFSILRILAYISFKSECIYEQS